MKRKGFRNNLTTLFKFQELRPGVKLLIVCVGIILAAVCAWVMPGETGVSLAMAGIAIKLKKDGLTGDNKTLFEELEKRFEELPEGLTKDSLKTELETRMAPFVSIQTMLKDIDPEILKEVTKAGDMSVRSILLEQGKVLKALQEKGAAPEELSIRSQLLAWRDKNKTALAAIKEGNKADLTSLSIRVATPMTPANSLSGTPSLPKPEWEAGVNELVRLQPTFWDYLRKGRSSSAVYAWVNKFNPLGAAAFIGPGVAKPGISFELKVENSTAKKIAASLRVAKELLDDIDGMQTLIETELRYQVTQKTNTTLLTTGVGSSTVPASIKSLSVAFTAVGLETTNPNNWDAIRAAVAQLRAGNLAGTIVAFVNPIDKANMDMTKAVSEGQVFIPSPPGAIIVEDNNMPVGFMEAAIIDYYKILMYEDYNIAYGWENDDFTKNLITVIGEMRFHQVFNDQYAGAFIYDSFANIKAAITAA